MAETAPITGTPAGEPGMMVNDTPDLDSLALSIGLANDMLNVGIANISIASDEDRPYFSCFEGARLMLEQAKRDIEEMYRRSVH